MTANNISTEPLSTTGFHPTWAQIDLSALVHNLNRVKALVGPQTQIMGIVKDDAYGHGAVAVSRTLLDNGASMLGVAYVDEALQLRAAGIVAPIILLSGVIDPEQAAQVVNLGIQLFVYSRQTAQILAAAAVNCGKTVKLHIKIDTGMGRLGIPAQEALEFCRYLAGLKGLEIVGLTSHLACAEDNPDVTQRQLKIFRQAVETVKVAGFNIPYLHLANSGGIINHPETHFNLVRPGIMLYGAYNPPEKANLRPVMSLKSKIIYLKKVAAGTPISYSHTYTAAKDSLIATVSVGYADGYNRLLSNRGQAIVCGQRVPVVGRVCMDLIMLDVTLVPNVQICNQVTLIGRDGQAEITVGEMSSWAQTIAYETLCLIGQRVRRVY